MNGSVESNSVLLFSMQFTKEQIKFIPTPPCRLLTIYNFGAARDSEVPRNISFAKPLAPNRAITHRDKKTDTRYKIQDIYYEFSAHTGAYTDASKCTNK